MAKRKNSKKHDLDSEVEFYVVSTEKLEEGDVFDNPDVEFKGMFKDISEAKEKAEEESYEDTCYLYKVSVPEHYLVGALYSALMGDSPNFVLTVLEEVGVYEPEEDQDEDSEDEDDDY